MDGGMLWPNWVADTAKKVVCRGGRRKLIAAFLVASETVLFVLKCTETVPGVQSGTLSPGGIRWWKIS